MPGKWVEKLRVRKQEVDQELRDLRKKVQLEDQMQAERLRQTLAHRSPKPKGPRASNEQTVPVESKTVQEQEISPSTPPAAQLPPHIPTQQEPQSDTISDDLPNDEPSPKIETVGSESSNDTENSQISFNGEMSFSPLKQDDSINSNPFPAGDIAGPIGNNSEELRYKTLVFISFPIFGIAILAMAGILIIKRKQLFSPKVEPVAKNRKNWCHDTEVTPLNKIRDLELGNANFFEQHRAAIGTQEFHLH